MKKFKEPLPSGGVPFFAEDFLMLQSELLKASLHMYSSLSTEVILSGCEPTLTGTGLAAQISSISAGYVMMRDKDNGMIPEIYFVPATTFSSPISTLWLVPGTDEVVSIRNLKSGSSDNIVINKKAQLIVTPSAAPNPGDPQIKFNPLPSVNIKDLLFRNSKKIGEIIPIGLLPADKGNPMLGPNSVPLFQTGSPSLGLGQYSFAGFAICNGNNGTPDLKRRFLAGMDPYHSYFDAIGKIGGAETVTLSAEYMPAHNHGLSDPGHSHSVGGGKLRRVTKGPFTVLNSEVLTTTDIHNNTIPNAFVSDFISSNNGTNITMAKTGGSLSHENRPPFYTTLYIQRIS